MNAQAIVKRAQAIKAARIAPATVTAGTASGSVSATIGVKQATAEQRYTLPEALSIMAEAARELTAEKQAAAQSVSTRAEAVAYTRDILQAANQGNAGE